MLAVLLQNGRLRAADVPKPRRRHGYALLRLRLAGICNTDLELLRGYYDFQGIPGHEFVATVAAADDDSLIGCRVVGEINLACRQCSWCARHLHRHCPQRTVLGIVRHPGAFAEFFTLPASNLHLVPDDVSDEEAVFTEPVAAACEILDQVAIPQGAEVTVVGDGKLGLLVAQVLHVHGARVRLLGRHPAKLRIARQAGIATEVVRGAPPARRYPFVVEATGSPQGLQAAISLTEPRGTLILKSTVHGRVEVNTAPLVVNEITVIGSRCGRFPPALDLIRSRRLLLKPLIHARYPLASASEAFKKAAEPGVLKVLLSGSLC